MGRPFSPSPASSCTSRNEEPLRGEDAAHVNRQEAAKNMPINYRLEVTGERASDWHRSRNFAAELHNTLVEKHLGTTLNRHRMTTELLVTFRTKRRLGEALQLLRELMSKHLMENDINVVRVQSGPV
jgi:hypothetical protein